MKIKKKIKIAIDSPAAAGAGTVAKKISKYFNLLYLDTGKIYRMIAFLKLKNKKNFKYFLIKKKMNKLKIGHLENKKLLNDKIGIIASEIAKDKRIRKLVHNFQIKCAYNFPKKYNGSCLDGRDITYKIIPNAEFKFFITANIKIRALRRYKELKFCIWNNFVCYISSIQTRSIIFFRRMIRRLNLKIMDYISNLFVFCYY